MCRLIIKIAGRYKTRSYWATKKIVGRNGDMFRHTARYRAGAAGIRSN